MVFGVSGRETEAEVYSYGAGDGGVKEGRCCEVVGE